MKKCKKAVSHHIRDYVFCLFSKATNSTLIFMDTSFGTIKMQLLTAMLRTSPLKIRSHPNWSHPNKFTSLLRSEFLTSQVSKGTTF